MQVFISWSGPRSRAIAEALREWLPMVINAVEPWMSAADVAPGVQWHVELSARLKDTTLGIFCVTPENRDAPWILYEAGALALSKGEARVVPYLIGLETTDVGGPLSLFQGVRADKEGTLHLIRNLANLLEKKPSFNLEAVFEAMWPHLEAALKGLPATPAMVERDPAKVQAEILLLARTLVRALVLRGKRVYRAAVAAKEGEAAREDADNEVDFSGLKIQTFDDFAEFFSPTVMLSVQDLLRLGAISISEVAGSANVEKSANTELEPKMQPVPAKPSPIPASSPPAVLLELDRPLESSPAVLLELDRPLESSPAVLLELDRPLESSPAVLLELDRPLESSPAVLPELDRPLESSPAVLPELDRPLESLPAAPAPPLPQRDVVVIHEKDKNFCKALKLYFRESVYEPVTVGEASDVIPAAREKRPAAILVAIEEDSAEARMLLAGLASGDATRGVPIVVMGMKRNERELLPEGVGALGASAYIKKPFIKKAILTVLDELLDRTHVAASTGTVLDELFDRTRVAAPTGAEVASGSVAVGVTQGPHALILGPWAADREALESYLRTTAYASSYAAHLSELAPDASRPAAVLIDEQIGAAELQQVLGDFFEVEPLGPIPPVVVVSDTPREGLVLVGARVVEKPLSRRKLMGVLGGLVVAEEKWVEASAEIADRERSYRYGGLKIEPQPGLVPLGRNAASGLWEFAHVLSGALPEWKDGQLVRRAEMAVVLVLLPGGEFWMGAANEGEHNVVVGAHNREGPVHQVKVPPFFLAKYPMTQGQWLRLTGANPSYFQRKDAPSLLRPVEGVSWEAGRVLCMAAGLRLPSEAEWEYGARAETQTPYSFAGGEHQLRKYAWYLLSAEEQDTTHSVGEKLPNAFGLHDVHGNLWEWCQDGYANSYEGAPLDGSAHEPTGAPYRVGRGGSFFDVAGYCRSAFRCHYSPGDASRILGLRPARSLQ